MPCFSMHYLTLATLFDYAVHAYIYEMFCFHRYYPDDLQTCVNLARRTFLVLWKKGGEICILFWNHIVWMFDILNEHGGMQVIYINLVVNSVLFWPGICPGDFTPNINENNKLKVYQSS